MAAVGSPNTKANSPSLFDTLSSHLSNAYNAVAKNAKEMGNKITNAAQGATKSTQPTQATQPRTTTSFAAPSTYTPRQQFTSQVGGKRRRGKKGTKKRKPTKRKTGKKRNHKKRRYTKRK